MCNRTLVFSLCITWLLLAAFPLASPAGMPTVLPSDLEVRWEQSAESRTRLQSISFFLVGLAASIVAVKILWNSLAASIQVLPRIDLTRAAALVVLWGLIFTLVLTMISGARELMTPGAWKQNGFTYELRQESESIDPANSFDDDSQ